MFGMNNTPNYRRADDEVAAYSSGPRSVLGAVIIGGAVPAYGGEGQSTSTRPARFGLFPGTPAYLTPPPPPPCPEPEPEVEEEEDCDCSEEEPSSEEEPGPDEAQPKCGPVTIVIKPKGRK